MDASETASIVQERKIPYLLHFTQLGNLDSILEHGIYPIARAPEVGATPLINDYSRYDGRRDATCLSISFPNSQMFYKYRAENESKEWIVLVIPPAILWLKTCAFCKHNAADGRISRQPLNELMTDTAFRGMFEELESLPTREEQSLKPWDPTDVQAEVLVFDTIEPAFIKGIVFMSAVTRDKFSALISDCKLYVHAKGQGLFASRSYARKYQR